MLPSSSMIVEELLISTPGVVIHLQTCNNVSSCILLVDLCAEAFLCFSITLKEIAD